MINKKTIIENLKTSPQLVRDSQFEDKDRNIVWFPAVINMGTKGIIFPEGKSKTNYVWKYAKVVEIPEEERANYNNYDKRLDVENAQVYGKFEFFKACQHMGIIQDLKPKDE